MKTVKWYKYGVFWRRGDGDNDHSAQDREDGVIDFIYNAITKYRRDGLYCEDAIQCFKESAEFLRQDKRYPDEFLTGYECKYWWAYYIRKPLRKLWKKLGIKLKPMYRNQFDMTRDPYKAFGSLYAFLYRWSDKATREMLTEEFNSLTIPLRIRHGGIMRWWNRFKRDNRKQFVKRLGFWEAMGTMDWYETHYANHFFNDIP